MPDSIANMPVGTTFAAKARAAELNAARARKAAAKHDSTIDEGETLLNEAPDLQPLSLGMLNFHDKRNRTKAGKKADALPPRTAPHPQHSRSSDNISGEIDPDEFPKLSVHHPLSLHGSRAQTPLSRPSSSHSSGGHKSRLSLREVSVGRIQQALIDTSRSSSPQIGQNPSDLRSPQPQLPHQTLSSQLDNWVTEMAPKKGAVHTAANEHPTSKPFTQFSLTLNNQARTSVTSHPPVSGPSASPDASMASMGSPDPHMPNLRQQTSSNASGPRWDTTCYGIPVPSRPMLHGPQSSAQSYGTSAHPSFSGHDPPMVSSAMQKFADIHPYVQHQQNSFSRPQDDPFVENKGQAPYIGATRYNPLPSTTFAPNVKLPPPAVKGTEADGLRYRHYQNAQQLSNLQRHRVPQDLRGSEQSNRSGPGHAPNVSKPLAAFDPAKLKLLETLNSVVRSSDGHAGAQSSTVNFAQDARASSKMQSSNLKPQARSFPFVEDKPVRAESPPFDRDCLKFSDPLPRALDGKYGGLGSPGDAAFSSSSNENSPPRASKYSMRREIGLDYFAEQEELFNMQAGGKPILKKLDIFMGISPPEHESVRQILLRRAGLKPLPPSAYPSGDANRLTREEIMDKMATEPTGKQAPIGSERRSFSNTENSLGAIGPPTPVPPMSQKEADHRAAIDVFAPILANLHMQNDQDYLSRYIQPPAWCVDNSPGGNKSFFGGEWGNPPRRVARDPRYLSSAGTVHEGRLTYFEDLGVVAGGNTPGGNAGGTAVGGNR